MNNNYASTKAIPGTKAAYARPELMLRTVFVALLLFTYGIARSQGPQNPRAITVNSIAATAGCPGQTITVTYTATGNYNNQNRFVAQLLSAANTAISQSPGLAGLSGTLNLSIPAGTVAGNYRVVVASTQLNNVVSAEQAFRVRPVTQITTQPGSQVADAFSAVTFSVAATGEALTYQWFRNNAIISGATAATYSLPAATAADAGTYSVQVTGACETRLSNSVTLTINKRTPAFAAVSAPLVISYNQAIVVSGNISTTVNGIERIPSGAVQVLANAVALGSATIAGDGTFAAALPANAVLGASATPYTLSFVYPGDDNFTAVNNNARQLVVNKAKAQLLVSGEVQTYDGAPKEVTITTEPAGLATTVSYPLPDAFRVNAGTYGYAASLAPNDNYEADPVSGTFTVQKAVVVLSIASASLTQVYDGTPKPVTVNVAAEGVNIDPAGLSGLIVRYAGSLNPPVNATGYQVDVALSNPNYQATPLRRILTIQKAVATLSINEATLTQVYDGQPKAVQVAVDPAGLSGVIVRYAGSLNPPTNATGYQVDVALSNPNYQATPLRRILSIVAAPTVASAARRATAAQPVEAPALFNLNAYPNPFADKFTLNIGSEVTGGVAITVIDGKGRSVTRQVVQAAGEESRTVEINLGNEEAGLYLLTVQSGAKREVIKVFKTNR